MKTYLIDLDGTMYKGSTILEGAEELLARIKQQQDRYIFLTNNATRTGQQNAEHMKKIGFKGINPEDFFTSSMAAARYIAKKSQKRRAYYLGKDGLKEALLQSHFILCDDKVDFVFVGLDSDATYHMYSNALHHLLAGATLVGTNSDRLLAYDNGFNIGNGSVVAMFEYASGQHSEQIGKPSKVILDEVLDYAHIGIEDAVLIGDNLETEIKMGVTYGVKTIFVTSGVHRREDIEKLGIYPSEIVETLKDIKL